MLQDEDHITLYHVDHLLTLSFELDSVPIRHAPFDLDNELFAFLHEALALAVTAILGVDLTFAPARRALLLRLQLHKTHVDQFNRDSLTLALRTGLLLTALGTAAFAFVAINISVDSVHGSVAEVKLF